LQITPAMASDAPVISTPARRRKLALESSSKGTPPPGTISAFRCDKIGGSAERIGACGVGEAGPKHALDD